MKSLIRKLRAFVRRRRMLRFFFLMLSRCVKYFLKLYFQILKIFLERIALLFALLYRPMWETSTQEQAGVLVIISKGRDKENGWTNYDYFHFLEPFEEFMKKSRSPVFVWLVDENRGFLGLTRFLMFLLQCNFRTVILSSWNPSAVSVGSPSPFILEKIKKKLSVGARFVILGWDTVTPNFWDRHLKLQFLDEIILLENPRSLGFVPAENTNEILITPNLPLPINTAQETEPSDELRSIDLAFFGQVNSYRDYRTDFLEVLEKYQKTSFISASKSGTSSYSYSEMFKILERSKLGVNFSRSVKDAEQLKGRVWEVLLSGALLLEQKNSQILHFFEPGKHFIFFESPSELQEQIEYFLHHENERRKIAEEGMKRARNLQMENSLFKHFIDT
jgi:hypothetical protein